MNDSILAIAAPGQNAGSRHSHLPPPEGLFDSMLESQILPVPPGGQNLSAAAIIQTATQQGIPLVVITTSNLSELQGLGLPPEAVARITMNVENGLVVIVPSQTVTIGGTPTTAWYVANPTTGEIIAQSQDGEHQGLLEYASTVGYLASLTLGFESLIFLAATAINPKLGQFAKGGTAAAGGVLANPLAGGLASPGILALFIIDLLVVTLAGGLLAAGDPPLPPEMVDLNMP